MKDRLIKCVRDFLSLRLEVGRSLLLAISGGSDSLALFLILLECRNLLNFNLHLAHVDHSYRSESQVEARILRNLASHFKVPFHEKKLNPMSGANLEDRFRNERYQFFETLQNQFHFQAVLIAHHADDQAETILKRICEGAHLGALGGLKPELQRGILTLWRPLLSIQKMDLIAYLTQKRAEAFDDVSNRDLKFLRARMRLHIFPNLEKHFGKQITGNFVRFGSLFQEMASYFNEKKKKIEEKLISGPFGFCLEQPHTFPSLELRFFLEEIARACSAVLSHDSTDTLIRLIEKKATKATILAPPLTFILNKGLLLILNRDFPYYNAWNWKKVTRLTTWKDVWKGVINIYLDSEPVDLNALTPILRKKIKKWYSDNAIPPFFHDKTPVFFKEGQIVGDCLTGVKAPDLTKGPVDSFGKKS